MPQLRSLLQDQLHKQHGTNFFECIEADQGRPASISTTSETNDLNKHKLSI